LSFIDRKYRFYSHGICRSDGETLEQASEHKLETMYDALQLKPGMRLLDIGAGWGGVPQYCGPRGIQVTSLTLTDDSHNYTDNLIKRMELKNCSIILEDFLNYQPKERYDAAVIYGVIEHI
jgi:cyclopropane fatty-acyl-phospholipid synthase-like methyltransferase